MAGYANMNLVIPSEQPWFVLNAARHFSLHTSALPSVTHIYHFEVAQSSNTPLAIPDACIDIIFDCDQQTPNARICGTTLKAQQTAFKPRHRYVGIRFAAGVTPDFSDLSAQELIDNTYNFLDVMPQGKRLFERVVNSHHFPEQIAAIESYLAPTRLRHASPLTMQATHSLCQHQGNMQIRQLEQLTGVSSRTLQRQFQADLGLSPKVFSRILRCQTAVRRINQNKDIIFSDLALELGFSDHSHFLREFKQFVSTTPHSYQKEIEANAYQQRIRYV